MRVAVLIALAACASSPAPREELPPWAGQDKHPCAGVDRSLTELTVEHTVVPDAAGSSSAELQVVNCCRGILFVDGEPKLALYEIGAPILELPPGKYKLAVEVEGRRPWQQYVTIAAGERVVMKPRR